VLGGKFFTGAFRQETYDPRWLTHGVMEFAPTEKRASWLYVSSGLSNGWEAESFQPDSDSGLGCEFIFHCPSPSRWAIAFFKKLWRFNFFWPRENFQEKAY
jgi:Suppressor of fused protein (SUFU)